MSDTCATITQGNLFTRGEPEFYQESIVNKYDNPAIFGRKDISSFFSSYYPTTVFKDIFIFNKYLTQWHKERNIFSTPDRIYECKSYKKIIRMGRRALPLIFNRLLKEGDEPDYWFFALYKITKKNPVPEGKSGNLIEASKIWITFLYDTLA